MGRFIKWFLSVVFAGFIGGCSYLENYFPDKERDYQYNSEIPLLNWPAEIRPNQPAKNALQSSTEANSLTETSVSENTSDSGNILPNQGADPAPVTESESSKPEISPTEVVNSETDDRTAITSVEIVKYDDGESRLRLGTGFSKAWRAVSKALSHNAIEVTERKHEQGLITIQYDPDEKTAIDDSFWDELNFFFHGINTNEEEYRLKLEEHNEQTDVLVLNKEHLPMLNNENAVRLLKVLAGTIKSDIADKDKKTEQAEPVQ